ncbi:MAG: hypothetical protein ACI8Q1_003162 [Parvicella sp.]|jgi:hypothetical protein
MLLDQIKDTKKSEEVNRLIDLAYMLITANRASKERAFLMYELRHKLKVRLSELKEPLFNEHEEKDFGVESSMGILNSKNEWKWERLAELLGISKVEFKGQNNTP